MGIIMNSSSSIACLAWLGDSSPTDYLQWLGLVASGGFVAWKYTKEKRIERSAAGNRLISELETNEWLRIACQMLDWTARSFLLPEEILKRRVPRSPEEEESYDVLVHSTSKMLGALTQQKRYSTDEVLYRDAFDALLTWLDRLHAGLDAGMFSEKDVQPVGYYVQALFDPRHHGKEAAEVITAFIRNYYDHQRFALLKDRLSGH